MKRFISILSVVVLVLILGSCETEYDPGETAVAEFAGEWYYELQDTDGNVIYAYDYGGPPMLTYNNADNDPDMLWVNDHGYTFPLKAEMSISGTAESFTGTAGLNEDVIAEPAAPTAGGQTYADTVDDYAYVEILEGKIMKDAARVWEDREKAVSDSIYLMFRFSSAILNYTSREVTKFNHDDSTTSTVYIWERDADFYQIYEELDTWVVAGHRQTGWEVYL